ncbi:MAG: tetratricopeptide repeat protein [Chitinophagales bacterium]|jgi:tetratricopeptide (TPR) repeat protein
MNFLFYYILLLSLLININSCGQAQISPFEKKKLTKLDSFDFKRFIDTIGKCSLFSIKRQNYLDSLLKIKPYEPNIWQQKAMPLFKQRKYELGMPYLDSAVKYDDKTHHFLEYRAFIKCIFQKSYKDAIKDFDLAIKLNGNHIIMDHSYEFYKGLCYLQLNNLDSAEYFIDKTVKDEMKGRSFEYTHYLHWFYLGIIKYEREDYYNANIYFDNCLKLYSQLPDALYYKAYCKKSKIGEAEFIKQLEIALSFANKGYSINEDNALYEPYPYQISKYQLDATIQYYKSNKD